MQVLLQAGVAVNAADFKGLTPLMTASMFGRTATAAFLLGMGASNDLMDINGDTALHWAAYKGHGDLIRLLMYSGTNLQKPDHFGSTPLHLACLSGSLPCVKLLCEKVIVFKMNGTGSSFVHFMGKFTNKSNESTFYSEIYPPLMLFPENIKFNKLLM